MNMLNFLNTTTKSKEYYQQIWGRSLEFFLLKLIVMYVDFMLFYPT